MADAPRGNAADARAWTCPSCAGAASANFCPACGERRLADAAPRSLTLALRPASSWLARLHASLRALASPPGRLTEQWLEGRRVAYLSPVALFLYTNIAFFIVQSASHVSILSWPLAIHLDNNVLGVAKPLFDWYAGAGMLRQPTYVAVFNALEAVHAKALVLLMVPALAAVMMVVPSSRRPRFERSFTFAAHFFTFALITMSALFPLVALTLGALARLGVHPAMGTIDNVVTTIQSTIICWYLMRALLTVTGYAFWQRLLIAALLFGATAVILQLYHLAVFVFTLLTV